MVYGKKAINNLIHCYEIVICDTLSVSLLCSFLKSKKSFDRYRHFDTMFTTSNPSFIKQIPANDTGDILICEIPFEPEVNLKEWKKFLEESLPLNDVYPDSIKAGTYQISVQFEIDEKGKINNVKILKNPGYGWVKELLPLYQNTRVRGNPPQYMDVHKILPGATDHVCYRRR